MRSLPAVWAPGFNPCVGKIPWRRKWQPTSIFLRGESRGRRSLAGYSLWGCKESDVTEPLHFHFNFFMYSGVYMSDQSPNVSFLPRFSPFVAINLFCTSVTVSVLQIGLFVSFSFSFLRIPHGSNIRILVFLCQIDFTQYDSF